MSLIMERGEEILAATDFTTGVELAEMLPKLQAPTVLCEMSMGSPFDLTIAEVESSLEITSDYLESGKLKFPFPDPETLSELRKINAARIFCSELKPMIFFQQIS